MTDILSTFEDLTQTDFETHADTLLSKQRTALQRKQVLTYLQTVNSIDHSEIETQRTAVRTRSKQNRLKESKLKQYLSTHSFDFSKHADLLDTKTLTSGDLDTLLATNDSEIFLNQNYTRDIVVTGDDVVLFGEGGNELSARTEELQNAVTINGDITVSGKSATFKNINFNSTTTGTGIKFTSGCEHVKFENCVFTAPSGVTDARFWFGQFFKGNAILVNCIIQNYTSWMLFDISSTSGEPQFATNIVRVKRCLFKNNLGSAAIRGKTGEATKLVQIINNKFITDTMHQYFWGFIEASGHIKKAEIYGNYFEAPTGNEALDVSRHAVQCWSKTAKPWTIYYKDNEIKNMKLGLCIAHGAGFFSPNTDSDNFLIDLSKTLTNVTHAASFAYKNVALTTPTNQKWLTGAAYHPDNNSVYPLAPTTVNPNSYSLVNGSI